MSLELWMKFTNEALADTAAYIDESGNLTWRHHPTREELMQVGFVMMTSKPITECKTNFYLGDAYLRMFRRTGNVKPYIVEMFGKSKAAYWNKKLKAYAEVSNFWPEDRRDHSKGWKWHVANTPKNPEP